MSLIWINGPDPNGECCGCEGKTGPCDGCSACEYPYIFPSRNDAIDFLQYIWQDCKIANQGFFSSPTTATYSVTYNEPDVVISDNQITGSVYYKLQYSLVDGNLHVEIISNNCYFCVSVKAGTEITLFANITSHGTNSSLESFPRPQGNFGMSAQTDTQIVGVTPYWICNSETCFTEENPSSTSFIVEEDTIVKILVASDITGLDVGEYAFTNGEFSVQFSQPATILRMNLPYENEEEIEYVTCGDE